jgi:hypothetical protein
MMARGYLCRLVLLTSVCVLSIFFFPAGQGPYPAVHGPITALQSLQNSSQLLFSFLLAGCLVCASFAASTADIVWRVLVKRGIAGPATPAESSPVMRC